MIRLRFNPAGRAVRRTAPKPARIPTGDRRPPWAGEGLT